MDAATGAVLAAIITVAGTAVAPAARRRFNKRGEARQIRRQAKRDNQLLTTEESAFDRARTTDRDTFEFLNDRIDKSEARADAAERRLNDALKVIRTQSNRLAQYERALTLAGIAIPPEP